MEMKHIFQLCAGIGLFLFAGHLLETSLKKLSGRNFKLFLQRVTKSKIGAVGGGVIIAGMLQSSSIVSLMVLAFVGAGVFVVENGLAIILGANLGTTLDSWLVATLGFKVNIEVVVYPIIFVGSLLLALSRNNKLMNLAYFLIGFSLLFIGLSFMKTAMELPASAVDFFHYSGYPPLFFLICGFVITLIVQSSSVTMALTLSALHAGTIDFVSAAAIVLGSETGTTIKLFIGSIGWNASKKRLALGNLFFNIFLTIVAFALLHPILFLITDVFNFHDPLIGLVLFSSLVNLFPILVFLPFLSPFSRFLERFFKQTHLQATAFIVNATVTDPVTALDLFRKETHYFIHNSMLFNLTLFEIEQTALYEHQQDFEIANKQRKFLSLPMNEKYELLKEQQGELQLFYLELRKKLEPEQYVQLNQLIAAVRSTMYALKSAKDIHSNITNFSRSSKNVKFDFFMRHKNETSALYGELNQLIMKKNNSFRQLKKIYTEVENNYSDGLSDFYKESQINLLEDEEITTAINFNHELFTSNKALLMAVKDLLLNEKEAEEFNAIPSYRI